MEPKNCQKNPQIFKNIAKTDILKKNKIFELKISLFFEIRIVNSGRECKYLHFVKNCRSTFRRQCNNAERSVP